MARSRLYRSRFLKVNIRWKALDEIYKIYMLLHHSDLNISETFRQTFSHFPAFFAKIRHFRILLIEFCSDVDEILSEFCPYVGKCWNIIFLNFLAKIPEFWKNKPLPPPRRSRGGGLSNVFILLIQKVSAIHVSIYCSCGEMFEVFLDLQDLWQMRVSLYRWDAWGQPRLWFDFFCIR